MPKSKIINVAKFSYRKNRSGFYVPVIILDDKLAKIFGKKLMTISEDYLTREEAKEKAKLYGASILSMNE